MVSLNIKLSSLLAFILLISCDKDFIVPTSPSTENKSSLMSNPPSTNNNNPVTNPYTGIWQLGFTNFKLSVPEYPNTNAVYCEGSNSYTGYYNWTTNTFNYAFSDTNCTSYLLIILTESGGSLTKANYSINNSGFNCTRQNVSVEYTPYKVQTGC